MDGAVGVDGNGLNVTRGGDGGGLKVTKGGDGGGLVVVDGGDEHIGVQVLHSEGVKLSIADVTPLNNTKRRNSCSM